MAEMKDIDNTSDYFVWLVDLGLMETYYMKIDIWIWKLRYDRIQKDQNW